MAYAIVNNATLVNTTTTQTVNYTQNYTVGSGSDRCLVIFCHGYKNFASNDFTVTPIDITVDGVAIPSGNKVVAQNLSTSFFTVGNYFIAPPSGVVSIVITNSFTLRWFSAQVIELTGIDQTTPRIGAAAGYSTGNQTSRTITGTPSSADNGVFITGAGFDIVNNASNTSISNGGTLIIAQNTPGSTASNDGTWAAGYETAPGVATGHTYDWVVSGRTSIVGFYLKDSVVTSINKLRTGTATPDKFYNNTTQVTKMFAGTTPVLT